MRVEGVSFLGFEPSKGRGVVFRAQDPTAATALEPLFHDATVEDVEVACRKAERAFDSFAALPTLERSGFLRAVADAIEGQGDALIDRAIAETGLPRPRLMSECRRTTFQFRTFADVVDEGSWVEARVDRPDAERRPMPRPDLRRMLHPLGPVAIFGASNFPLAFSVAGGDTVSAFAAGCTVVAKAHPAHPGTCELVARAILGAAREKGMPDGVFSLVQGVTPDVGAALVSHPAIKAVGFTGSLRGGRALFDRAQRRDEPIPFFGELGSANPVFILPGALAERGEAIAAELVTSMTMGAGQFCTNPGLTILPPAASAQPMLDRLASLVAAAPAGTMVQVRIKETFDADVAAVAGLSGVTIASRSTAVGPNARTDAHPTLLATDARSFERYPRLGHEIYGPSTLAVRCSSREEVLSVARSLHGHLTATLYASANELAEWADLIAILRRKVGRLVINNVPTGVEVSRAMQHGGPYPASTDSRTTSVGTAAIGRFARPVCYQDFPDDALPPELRNANPAGIWRMIDGALTKDAV